MKQVCLLCERVSPDSNLYCQEMYCPAEMSPNILDYGEWLGDIEIVKAVMTLRSAVLYDAYHQKKRVFLKVAHPGEENKERLKREAEFLKHMQLQKQQHEFLPVLLPPYTNTKIETDAYGKAMLKGHLLYFYMFEHVPGEPLRDVLMHVQAAGRQLYVASPLLYNVPWPALPRVLPRTPAQGHRAK